MPKRRLTSADYEEMAELRERSWSYERIASKFGVSPGCVAWNCLRLGAEPRRLQGKPRHFPVFGSNSVVKRGNHLLRHFTPEEDAKLAEFQKRGLTVSQMARELGRKPNSVTGRLLTIGRHEECAKGGAA